MSCNYWSFANFLLEPGKQSREEGEFSCTPSISCVQMFLLLWAMGAISKVHFMECRNILAPHLQ